MNWNHYRGDYENVLDLARRELGLFQNIKKIQQKDYAKLINLTHNVMSMGQADPRMQRGNLSTQELKMVTAQELELMYWSGYNLFSGVEIRIKDVALLEALMRSDVDALVEDVQLPFPVCEFVFPEGVRMPDTDYQLSGCLLLDRTAINVVKYWEKHGATALKYGHPQDSLLKYAFGVSLRSPDGQYRVGHNRMTFGPQDSLTDLPIGPTMFGVSEQDKIDHVVTTRHAHTCLALCLYLQTKEGQKAMEQTNVSVKYSGRPGMIASVAKKRSKYVIRDLITDKFYQSVPGPTTGAHASPRAHWRRLHMRSLRHQRYKRNEDGSIKVIWVKPSLVGAESDEHLKQVRKVG